MIFSEISIHLMTNNYKNLLKVKVMKRSIG